MLATPNERSTKSSSLSVNPTMKSGLQHCEANKVHRLKLFNGQKGTQKGTVKSQPPQSAQPDSATHYAVQSAIRKRRKMEIV